MNIVTNFPGGSLGRVLSSSTGELVSLTRRFTDRTGLNDQRYWFSFRLPEGAPDGMRVVLEDLIGRYRGEPHDAFGGHCAPVFSRDDGTSWERATQVCWDAEAGRLSLLIPPVRGAVHIAYAHPYPPAAWDNLREEISKGGREEIVGKSWEGRDLVVLHPHRSTASADTVVVVCALAHSGEDCGGWFVDGLARALSKAGEADSIRWVILPCLNPDGHFRGIPRLTAAGYDANAHWWQDEPVPAELPEVAAVRRFLEKILAGPERRKVILDIHSWSQFFAGHGTHSLDQDFGRGLCEGLEQVQAGSWRHHCFNRPGTLARWAIEQPGVTAATIELSQSLSSPDGRWLTVDDYLRLGAALPSVIRGLIAGSGSSGQREGVTL